MFSRLCPCMCGVYTTSWRTSKTASQDYCTPHGSVRKAFTATPKRASRENGSRAQNSSVWLHLNRCVTASKILPCRGGESHHELAHTKSLVRRHIQGQTLGILFGVPPVRHRPFPHLVHFLNSLLGSFSKKKKTQKVAKSCEDKY